MKCPCCGAAELIHDTRDMPYTYKGETITIPAVTGDFCPACSEVVLNREHGDRYGELIRTIQRQVNSAYVQRRNIADALAMPGIADIEFEPPRMTIETQTADFS